MRKSRERRAQDRDDLLRREAVRVVQARAVLHLVRAGLDADAGQVAIDGLEALVPVAGAAADLGAHRAQHLLGGEVVRPLVEILDRDRERRRVVRRQHAQPVRRRRADLHGADRDPAALEQLLQRVAEEQRRLRDAPVERARIGAHADAARDVDARVRRLFLGVDGGRLRSAGRGDDAAGDREVGRRRIDDDARGRAGRRRRGRSSPRRRCRSATPPTRARATRSNRSSDRRRAGRSRLRTGLSSTTSAPRTLCRPSAARSPTIAARSSVTSVGSPDAAQVEIAGGLAARGQRRAAGRPDDRQRRPPAILGAEQRQRRPRTSRSSRWTRR